MPVSIKNVKTDELDFGDIAAKLEKAYAFLKLDQADRRRIKELIPTHTRRIQFDLVANTALANSWRRAVLDEIEWPRLTCSMQDDIRTDDEFNSRLTDYIQNRIQLIPTSYVAKDKGTMRYKLDIKNMTQQPMIVRSNDIEHVSGPKLTLGQNIDLCNLMPGRFIRIQIGVEWGTNRTHATFTNFHGVTYRPLTVGGKSLDHDKLPPSYSVHPDSYRLGLTCEEFVDARAVAQLGWQTIADKLKTAAARIKTFIEQSKTLPYLTDELSVTQIRGGIIRYEFKRETLTLTNILSWYAYEADRSVTYLQAGDDHPEDDSSLIRIVHKDHARILEQAATRAAADCMALAGAL